MPPAVYAVLVWRRFGGIDLTGYVPHEALGQALAGGDAAAILAAPLVSLNMTSGALLANMYELTVGQAVLTAALGAAIALNAAALTRAMRARRVCAARAGGGAAAASTGIMGCCGSGAVGGALALAGLGAASAGAVAAWSPAVQALLAAGLAANWLRLRRAAAAG